MYISRAHNHPSAQGQALRLCSAPARRQRSGQALTEIAIFGAIFIFLIGMIIRSHLSSSFAQNHKVRAVKVALKQSYEGSFGNSKIPNTSRNSATVLFVEDRLTPDFNKFNTLDRAPFIAQGSATMTNMLQYPVDYGEYTKNIPIMDLYVNGQHFELTLASFVYRNLYSKNDVCPSKCDALGNPIGCDSAEKERCERQKRELKDGTDTHKFYTQLVNGTKDYEEGDHKDNQFDLLRNDGDLTNPKRKADNPPESMYPVMAWKWKSTDAKGEKLRKSFGSESEPSYPLFDTSGSLREQTLYYISSDKVDADDKCKINGNKNLFNIGIEGCFKNGDIKDPRANPVSGDIKAVGVMDDLLGDYNAGWDPNISPGKQPGPTQEMQMYTNIKGNKTSYLEIKEGKLYNPETQLFVRSMSNKDKVDLITRTIQLSNDTGRLCRDGDPVKKFEDDEDNPVKACGDCTTGITNGISNFNLTCFDPKTRILYVRSNLIDSSKRGWFTNIAQGL